MMSNGLPGDGDRRSQVATPPPVDGPTQKEKGKPEGRLHTGVEGLDDVLDGGIPTGHLYLVEGDPGTGKTTLALQFLLEGMKSGEKGMYITLSESKQELEQVAESHGW